MTIGICVLLVFLYLVIGAAIGYWLFTDDEGGIIMGELFWPALIAGFVVYAVLAIPYKIVAAIVKSFKRIRRARRRKAKESLGQGTDEKEQFTKCDRCPWLKDCRDLGRVIDVTGKSDSRLHYILQLGETCDRGLFHWDYDAEEEELSEKSEDKR